MATTIESKLTLKKVGNWWYVCVFNHGGKDFLTWWPCKTKREANELRQRWIIEKIFGEAEEG